MAEDMQAAGVTGEQHDEIRAFSVGPIPTNCYAYISEGHCMVVDPGGEGAEVARELADCTVELVVATHGHGDHVGGVAALVKATGAHFLISKADETAATTAASNATLGLRYDADAPTPDGYLAEGDVLEVGSARFCVHETPGHTPGGVVLVGEGSAEGVCFVGDTLFAGSVGRTDLPGGNMADELASIKKFEQWMATGTTILSGHGPATTLARELECNPYLS